MQVLAVAVYRVYTDKKFSCNLCVGVPFGDQLEHFLFPFRKGTHPVLLNICLLQRFIRIKAQVSFPDATIRIAAIISSLAAFFNKYPRPPFCSTPFT